MKKFAFFILLIGFLTLNAQNMEFGFNTILGVTAVNVEEAIGTTLEDWNTFSYGFILSGFYYIQESLAVGVDLGFHRLYSWNEYYDYPIYSGYSGYYRGADISTIHFGPNVQMNFDDFFVQSGLHLRIFTNGSGAVPAIMLGGGYNISLNDFLVLPVGARTDIVFGSATPISFNVTVGIKYILHN